jgi:hypothetical protein
MFSFNERLKKNKKIIPLVGDNVENDELFSENDLSLLDIIDSDELLTNILSKATNNYNELWRAFTFALKELKKSRTLIQLNNDICQRQKTLSELSIIAAKILSVEHFSILKILELSDNGCKFAVKNSLDSSLVGSEFSCLKCCHQEAVYNRKLVFRNSLESSINCMTPHLANIRNLLCFPIIFEGNLIGLIEAGNRPFPFNENDDLVLQYLAQLICYSEKAFNSHFHSSSNERLYSKAEVEAMLLMTVEEVIIYYRSLLSFSLIYFNV